MPWVSSHDEVTVGAWASVYPECIEVYELSGGAGAVFSGDADHDEVTAGADATVATSVRLEALPPFTLVPWTR